ncbi:MAG TPA: nuclear transport factor 2 family protein [Methylocella sp.]|nr:nuclear transport factor 2 family protein [Methylocella sp.]
MYHAIVAARIRKLFKKLGEEDYSLVLDNLAPQCEHSFFGSHALGGTRRTRAAIQRWYERLPCVLPRLSFEVKRIIVTGWPWATTAVVEWHDFGHAADGTAIMNQGVHVVELRWGKTTAIRIYCDTALLGRVLERNAACGITEAVAQPIAD